jgi:hypothetical protein
MSTDNTTPEIDIPDEFYENYDSIHDAAAAASSTDPDAQPRCPNTGCGSIDITRKASSVESMPQRKAGDWRCKNCGHHFDDPRPPRRETAGRQATLEEVTE